MNLHHKDTGNKNMRPGQTVPLRNCLYLSNEAGCSQTVSVLQNPSRLLDIINFKKRHMLLLHLDVEHPI